MAERLEQLAREAEKTTEEITLLEESAGKRIIVPDPDPAKSERAEHINKT